MNNTAKKSILITGLILAGAVTVRDFRKPVILGSAVSVPAQFDFNEEMQSLRGPIRKGGLKDLATLKAWVLAHKALYPNFDVTSAKLEYAQFDFWAYVQYRDGSDNVKWTHHLVLIQKGEVIYKDADGNMIRGKCGNGLTLVPPAEDDNESFATLLGQPEPASNLIDRVGDVPDNPILPAPPIEIPPTVGPITVFEPIPCCGVLLPNEPIHTEESSSFSTVVVAILLVLLFVWYRGNSKWTL